MGGTLFQNRPHMVVVQRIINGFPFLPVPHQTILPQYAKLMGHCRLGHIQGISQFFLFSEMREAGTEGAGWVLAGGVLNAFLGIVILTNPLVSWFAISTVWGIYFSVSGIALVAESLSGHRGRRGDA